MRSHQALLLSFSLTLIAIIILMLKPFYPHHRYVAVTIYALSWIPFAYGFHQHRKQGFFYAEERKVKRYLKHHIPFGIGFILLVMFAYIAWVLFPVQEFEFLAAEEQELRQEIEEDLIMLPIYVRGAEDSAEAIEESGLFARDITTLSPAERAEALALWSQYLGYAIELDSMVQRHKYFYQISYLKHPELNVRSFLIAYNAFLAKYETGLVVTGAVDGNEFVQTLLNEENPILGIPASSYYLLNQGTTDDETLMRLQAGRNHLAIVNRIHDHSPAEQELADMAEQRYSAVNMMLLRDGTRFVSNPFSSLEHTTFTYWFPVQKEVARTMGHIRFTGRENFITPETVRSVQHKLKPGDILLERRNWYLTNAGLPGFWPHAAIYVGDLEQLDREFANVTDMKPSEHIKERYPEIAAQLVEPMVIEAIEQGVTLQTLEHSANADYVAAMRPRISDRERWEALLVAFSHYGKPYDFNFDFVTDNQLVCSELVYKSYDSVNFTLSLTAGRLVLAPVDMARKFDEEYGTPRQDLDFVLFLDGSEQTEDAVERDVQEFRESWKRPKWSAVQE